MFDTLLLNANLATMRADGEPFGTVRDGAIGIGEGRIAWVGKRVDLPGAFYFLREKRLPPIEALRRHGVPIAISTDSNPGSSPLVSILLTMNLACTLFRLTPQEALAGVTRNAARALGMGATHGTIEPGKVADLAFWEIAEPAELAYAMGANPCVGVLRAGSITPPQAAVSR